jgi:methyltransferase (TIGR00027 family)
MNKNKPSNTAIIVARNIAFVAAGAKTAHLVNGETARSNEALLNEVSRFSEIARKRWFQRIFRSYEFLTIRGLALHQALRKLHIERIVRTSLAEGFEQIVILGGGLDTLALRLHREFPDVNFLELDHPATQNLKRETIRKLGLRRSNLNFLTIDFTEAALAASLTECPDYFPKAKTVFVCEGVLMYLSEPEVKRIFSCLKNQPAADLKFIFTFMEPDKAGRTNFRDASFVVRLWLKWKNEPFKWGLDKICLSNFLTSQSFELKVLVTQKTFRRTYLSEKGLSDEFIAKGENLCVCQALRDFPPRFS